MLTILGSSLVVGALLSAVLIYLSRSDVLTISGQHLAELEQNARDNFENSIIDTTRQLSNSLVNPVYYNEFSLIGQQFSAAKNIPNIEAIYLLDTHGMLLHEGDADFPSLGQNIGLQADTLKRVQTGEYVLEEITNGLRVIAGIFLGDQLLAILFVESSSSNLMQSLEKSRTRLEKNSRELILVFSFTAMGITLFLMVLAAIGSWVMAEWIVKPITLIQEQAQKLGSGELHIEDRIDREDEIGELAKSIYTMAADLELQNRSVKYLAFHDPLTGIANRSSFQMDLEDQIVRAAERKSSCALMFIDIDDFKDVNDSKGHDLGDRTLKTLADRISDAVHGFYENTEHHPSIARIGGDEFTTILPGNKNEQELREVAEKILESIAKPIVLEEDMHQLSASIGISRYPRDGVSASMILNAADTAMYNSKFAGKGTYRFFEHSMSQQEHNQQKIKIDFKQAISRSDELELLYQPIANITTGAIYGGEALMRWNHPTLGQLEPSQFISVVENNEIALAADLWVIESTLALLESMDLSRKPNFVVSANISASNLVREQFPEAVARLLEQSPVNPKHLQLEITETYLHRDEEKALESLKALRSLGVKLWLDDFCTGYSSLKHLHMFPANGIKIDRQFVINLNNSNEDRLLVSAMISLANSFNIGIVAEGIDNQTDRELLMALECELGQGDLFSKPLPAPDFIELVKEDSKLPV